MYQDKYLTKTLDIEKSKLQKKEDLILKYMKRAEES